MNRLMKRLKSEHRRLATMMELLAGQALTLRDGGDPDLYLLRDVLDYCADYTNLFHHPAEDRALDRLLTKRPELVDSLGALRLQHGELAQRTQGLLAQLSRLMVDAPVPREQLRRELSEFVDLNVQHRSFEEVVVFPALVESLDARDWRDLEERDAVARHDAAHTKERRHLRRLYRWLAVEGAA